MRKGITWVVPFLFFSSRCPRVSHSRPSGRARLRIFRPLIFAFLFLASWLGVCSCLAVETRPPVTEHTLPNGLRVLIVERHDAPIFSAHIRYRVGSVNDPPGLTGLAHFVEHLFFKGTELFGSTDPDKEKRIAERLGSLRPAIDDPATPTDLRAALARERTALESAEAQYLIPNDLWNTYRRHGAVAIGGITYRDSTQYMVSLPKNALELWALLEADRLRHPVFRGFEAERRVVQEEYRQVVETSAPNLLEVSTYGLAFTAVPYNHPPWGWPPDVRQITRADAEAFARTYYVPNNALIVLVGDLEPRETLRIVERYFGPLPARPVPPVPRFEEPTQAGQRRIVVPFPAEPQLRLFFQAPPATHPDIPALSLLSTVLVHGRTSRLHRRLVEEHPLALRVSSDTSWVLRYTSLFSLEAAPRPPHGLRELESAIMRELDILKTDLVSAEELQRAKTLWAFQYASRLSAPAELAAELACSWDLSGDWEEVFTLPDTIRSLTPERLRDAARRYLRPDRSTVGWLLRPAAPTTSPARSGS